VSGRKKLIGFLIKKNCLETAFEQNKMASSLIIICSSLLLIWLIQFIKKQYSYFSDRGILSPKPIFPLGNFWKVGISTHFIHKINSIYQDFKGKDVLCGFYVFTKPVFLILDPELLKNILVKDFYSFHDRGLYHNEHTDPLSAHLFSVNIFDLQHVVHRRKKIFIDDLIII
jgi:cytochrome P450 family 6